MTDVTPSDGLPPPHKQCVETIERLWAEIERLRDELLRYKGMYLRDTVKLTEEIERLTGKLQDAGAYTLSERWSQQQTEIEQLQRRVAELEKYPRDLS